MNLDEKCKELIKELINPTLIKVYLILFFIFFKLNLKDLIELYKSKKDNEIEESIENFEQKLGIPIEKSFLFEVNLC